MGLIDLILNIAGVLLWLNWRGGRLDPMNRAVPATLAGTLRRAEPLTSARWHVLGGLVMLICGRALLYSEIGPAVNWSPKLNLGLIAPAFPVHRFIPELLFSTLSFLRMLMVFYFWLLFLAIINRKSADPDPLQKTLMLQLGRVARWPAWLQAALPILAVAALWIAFYPLLAYLDVINWATSKLRVVGQGLLLGFSLFLTLKYLLPAFLLLHLVASYVYLGANPFWDFVATTSRNLLGWMPLRFGKVDLAPVVGLLLVTVAFYFPVPQALRSMLQYLQEHHHLTLWPG